MRRAVALVLIAGGMLWPAVPASARAAESYDGACTDNAGVTVVVDFQDLGGGVNLRCATGDVASGLDALDRADISWQGTLRFPGFVCRIAGQPGPDDDPCVNTPPDTAHWTYWVASRGAEWCYSSFGAANRTPPPGTVEGWSFAKNRTATDLSSPGYDPPPPPEGQPAQPLNGSDCPASGGNPATTTTAAEVASTPLPAVTTTAPTSEPTAAPVATATTRAATTNTTSTTVPGITASTTSVAPPTDGSSTTSSAASATPTSAASGADTTTRSLDAVDLRKGGESDGGVSAFTVLAVVAMLTLVGTGVVLARRRRATP